MTAIIGSQVNAALVLGASTDAWGTAKAAGAGHKMRASISPSFDVQKLIARGIGGGAIMTPESRAGRQTPVVTLTMDGMYDGAPVAAIAQIMGYSYSPVEVTTDQHDYRHRLTLNTTANTNYLTVAWEDTDAKTIELPTAAVRSLTVSFQETDSFVQVEAECLGNEVELDSAVNTNAVLAAATIAETEYVVAELESKFWLNAMTDGALDSGDQTNVNNFTFTLTRPQDFSGVVKGSAGNDEPDLTDVVGGTLSVRKPKHADHTYFDAWAAGTKFKAKLLVEGTQIGSGTNKSMAIYFPCLKIVEFPDSPLTETGYNPETLNFEILAAPSVPTGMNSIYPYFEIVNTRSTVYLS